VADQEAVVLEAAEMAASGQGFEQIAAALKGKGIERTELGPVRKGDLPEALDQTVFATDQGTTAAPVSSAFGWHLIKVTEVTPEATRSFADVRGDLEQELKMQRASEQLPDFANKLDDEIAAGTSLDEAASRLGLQALKIDAVDRQGQNRKQEAVAADRLTPEILGMVFSAGQGEPSLLNHAQNGSFYMFRVDSIDPARPRTLEEVRDVLSTAWKKEQQAERAKARAEELRAKVTDATALDAVAAAVQGVQKIDVGPLKRDDQGYLFTLTPEAVKLMFETPAGATVARAVPALDGSAVLVVDEVIAPQPEAAARDQARTALANDMRSDVLAQYEAALRQRYPVQVDQGQLASLMEAQAQ
jgi:peptidyl-prolyl cis-trans isomerase D